MRLPAVLTPLWSRTGCSPVWWFGLLMQMWAVQPTLLPPAHARTHAHMHNTHKHRQSNFSCAWGLACPRDVCFYPLIDNTMDRVSLSAVQRHSLSAHSLACSLCLEPYQEKGKAHRYFLCCISYGDKYILMPTVKGEAKFSVKKCFAR